jgi:hypothetical protein
MRGARRQHERGMGQEATWVSGFQPQTLSVKTACEREERRLLSVAAVARTLFARASRLLASKHARCGRLDRVYNVRSC